MKKILLILCVVVFSFSLTACGSTNEVSQNSKEAPEIIQEEDIASVAPGDEIEIVAEYTLSDSMSWYTRHFIVIKNNSNETLDVSTSGIAYDVDGNVLGAADASFDALGAGCTSVMYEAYEVEGAVDHYDSTLNSSPSRYYESVIQDLSYEQTDIAKGAVFQVTNNGSDAAQFVEGYALFIKDGSIVAFESTYFTDDDSELKSGATLTKQFDTTHSYDSIEFYLTGRK